MLLHDEQIKVTIVYLRNSKSIYKANGITYATHGSIGLDLRACIDQKKISITPGERLSIPSGIAIEPLTQHIAGFIYSRSGLGAISGLTVAQGVGVIDPDYRGEIIIVLLNTSKEDKIVSHGDRIAQLVFQPAFQAQLYEVSNLEETDRGASGFGHTGEK